MKKELIKKIDSIKDIKKREAILKSLKQKETKEVLK